MTAGPGLEPTPPSSQHSSRCASPHQQDLGSALRTDFSSKTHEEDPEKKKSHDVHGTRGESCTCLQAASAEHTGLRVQRKPGTPAALWPGHASRQLASSSTKAKGVSSSSYIPSSYVATCHGHVQSDRTFSEPGDSVTLKRQTVMNVQALHHFGFSQSIYFCSNTSVCSCSAVSGSLRPHGLQSARLLCPWDSPDKSTGVGCHFLLQGIFPTQGRNPRLLHCRRMFYY